MTKGDDRMQDMKQVYEYLDDLRRTGRKETTIKTYEKVLTQVITILGESGRPTKAEEITTDEICYLYRTLTTKEETTRFYLRVLSGMVYHYTSVDIVKKSNLLWNRAQHNRRFLSDSEVRTLYQAGGPVERIIIVLGAFMGLRREEISKIRDEDIHGDTITIHGKGHTEAGLVKDMRMPPFVQRELDAYRSWKRRYLSSGDGYLVQTASPKTRMMLRRITPSNVAQRLRVLGESVGIHVSPHALRRYFATTIYYQVDCDIQTMASMMRHANVSTTFKCYVQPYDAKERETQAKVDNYIASILA